MDVSKGREEKGNLMIKTWERCKSLGHGSNKSWPRIDIESGKSPRKRQVAPDGCFSVYVGPQKQRFVIKTEYANHPLFKILLEEAESEYGFKSEGPLELPCNVDIFWKVLLAIDDKHEIHQGRAFFMNSYGSYRLLSPSRLVAFNRF